MPSAFLADSNEFYWVWTRVYLASKIDANGRDDYVKDVLLLLFQWKEAEIDGTIRAVVHEMRGIGEAVVLAML